MSAPPTATEELAAWVRLITLTNYEAERPLRLLDEALAAERRSLLDSPDFRRAVDAVFAAPGDPGFGPAQGYYGPDTDHFIDMLKATFDAQAAR